MSKHESRPESAKPSKGDSGIGNGSYQAEQSGAADKFRAEASGIRGFAFTGGDSSTSGKADQPKVTDNAAGSKPDSRPAEVIRRADHERPQVKLSEMTQSVQDLITRGIFKKVEPAAQEAKAPAVEKSGAGDKVEGADKLAEVAQRTQPAEKIKVVFTDQNNDPTQRVNRPDFRVKKDGSVEVLSDPEKHNNKEIVVEVERDQGQLNGPSEAQQKSVDELVGYLSNRLMQDKADGTRNGVIEDKQGLVTDRAENATRTRPAPERNLDEPTRQQVERAGRFSGGGRGHMSPQETDSYFPPRDVPRQADESDYKAALKDVVASLAAAGQDKPYEAVRQRGDQGVGVGRYMLTYSLLMDWLSDAFGDPPDPAKIDEMVKKGKLSPKMAAAIKSGQFKQFAEKLKSGQQPSAAELKELMPKELQEQIASDLVQKFATATLDSKGNVDPGKVALAFQVGRVPTEQDIARPESQSLMQAAERLSSISQARMQSSDGSVDWQDVNGRTLAAAKTAVGQALWREGRFSAAGLEYGNLGCADAVTGIFQRAGIKGIHSASVRGIEADVKKLGGQVVSNPQPGDIVLGHRGAGKHGHIGIVAENGKVIHNSSAKRHVVEANLNSVFNSSRFETIRYYRLPSQTA